MSLCNLHYSEHFLWRGQGLIATTLDWPLVAIHEITVCERVKLIISMMIASVGLFWWVTPFRLLLQLSWPRTWASWSLAFYSFLGFYDVCWNSCPCWWQHLTFCLTFHLGKENWDYNLIRWLLIYGAHLEACHTSHGEGKGNWDTMDGQLKGIVVPGMTKPEPSWHLTWPI